MTYGPILIFIAAILLGLDGVLRRGLYSLPPATIVFYEHLIGAIILLPFAWKFLRGTVLTKKEWYAIGAVSLLSGALGTILFTGALGAVQYISFSVVYLVQKLQPIFVVATASLLLKERPSFEYFSWAALALLAGYFVTFPNGLVQFGSGDAVTAALLALGAAIAWGCSTAISRYALLHHNPTHITALRFLVTLPIAFLAVLILGSLPSLGTVSVNQFGILGLIAVSTGMLALWIYYNGLKKTPASVAAIVELAFPMTAVLVDYVLYGQILTLSQVIAAGVLLFAAYRVSKTINV